MLQHSLFVLKTLAYTSVCALGGALILWLAWLNQSAADTVDRSIRPLGFSGYQHPPGPVYVENDSYYWLLMAERMRDDGVARIRWTQADNAPQGRPVYWSQGIAWLINGLAVLPPFRDNGAPLAAASFWVNPLLQFLVLGGLVALLAPLGWRLMVVTAAFFVSLGDIGWAFSSLRPDHQSLQAAFAILMITALFREGFGFGRPRIMIGDSANRGPASAPRMFAFAGLCAGAGLWVSSAVFMPVLIALSVAVCAVALMSLAPESSSSKCWLLWGAAAGLTSLAFWLVEFFPQLEQTRLEVNNPAFALWVFLLGCGMALAMGLPAKEGNLKVQSFGLLALVTLLSVILPAVILFGPTAWYWPRDISMDRLHNFIMEFYTFGNFTKGKYLSTLWGLYYLALPLGFVLIAPALRSRDAASRAAFWILFLLMCALFAMSMRQIRWLALFAPVLALAAGVSTACLSVSAVKLNKCGRLVSMVIVLGLLFQAAFLAAQQVKALNSVIAGRSLLNELVPAVLNKHFAVSLDSLPDKPAAVMADPNLAPALYYFARIPSVASFYWENRNGVRDAGIFFADSGDLKEASKIAQQRGVTHIIVPSGPIFPNYFDFVKHGHYDKDRAKTTLAAKLTEGSALSLPDWIEVDDKLDGLGKAPFSYKGETLEQYLNVYKVVWPRDNAEEPVSLPSNL
jgi:hypothetical protein